MHSSFRTFPVYLLNSIFWRKKQAYATSERMVIMLEARCVVLVIFWQKLSSNPSKWTLCLVSFFLFFFFLAQRWKPRTCGNCKWRDETTQSSTTAANAEEKMQKLQQEYLLQINCLHVLIIWVRSARTTCLAYSQQPYSIKERINRLHDNVCLRT